MITVADPRPSPGPVHALTDIPDRNAPIVAPCHIYLIVLKRCNSRSEDEMIVGPPSVDGLMARS